VQFAGVLVEFERIRRGWLCALNVERFIFHCYNHRPLLSFEAEIARFFFFFFGFFSRTCGC
jgi:hypothetical protein